MEHLGATWLKPNKVKESILKVFILSLHMAVAFTTLFFVLMGSSDWYFYSLLPQGGKVPILFAANLIIEALLVMQMPGAFTVCFFTQYFYFASTNFWLDFVG
jgi:hypothetical protein